MIVRIVLLLVMLARAASAQIERLPETEAGQRRALQVIDAGVGRTSWTEGVMHALTSRMTEDAIALFEGAPILRGRALIERTLAAEPLLPASRVSWQPLAVLVSSDLRLGVTYGVTVVQRGEARPPVFGRYVSVWRRADSTWKMVAHVQNGLLPTPNALVIPGAMTGDPRDAFADADRAFARMARDSGGPAAFARFAAPNAMTFGGGGELNLGPGMIRARMTENGAGRIAWKWRPVVSIVAGSGDVAVTIGEADLQPPTGPTIYSKYLTVWQRQPDGSIKFVVDAGNARNID